MKKIVRTFLQNDEWKFLLVRHKWKDYWSLPGWHLKSKESIYKGLKREIKEELNLEIEFLWEKLWLELEHITEFPQPNCTYKIIYNEFNWKEVKKLEYIFLTKIKSGKIKIQEEEIDEYDFFSKEEILAIEANHLLVKELLKRI